MNSEKKPRHKQHYRTPRRYRIELINENTLSRLWSLRLSGIRILLALAATVAAIASLIFVILTFTPVRGLLPGQLRGDLRQRYIASSLRLDSLQHAAALNDAYTRNILAILGDSVTAQDTPATTDSVRPGIEIDSLAQASDRERRFVQQYESTERYNLSVLAPIAAEGMIFEQPTSDPSGAGPVSAIYRGTVIACHPQPDGHTTVLIQHPNDFISVYTSLADTYVAKGDKVSAAQRIGHTTKSSPLVFELWHGGTSLDPSLYIQIN